MNSHFLNNSNYTYTSRVLFIQMRYLVFYSPFHLLGIKKPFLIQACALFLTLRSLSLPVSSSYTRAPKVHPTISPHLAHRLRIGDVIHQHAHAISLVRISGRAGPPTYLWEGSTSSVSQCWSTESTCGEASSSLPLEPPERVADDDRLSAPDQTGQRAKREVVETKRAGLILGISPMAYVSTTTALLYRQSGWTWLCKR